MARSKSTTPKVGHYQKTDFKHARIAPPEGMKFSNAVTALKHTLEDEREVGERTRLYPDTPAGRRLEDATAWVDQCREMGLNPLTGLEIELSGDFFEESEETGERV